MCRKTVFKGNDFNLNIPLYVEKIIEDNLPAVEEALKDLKAAWEESLKGRVAVLLFFRQDELALQQRQ